MLEPGLPIQDMQPGGLISGSDMWAYATREARVRLHQQRFKLIDPDGVVHIARRLLDETDGPMLRTGLQGFRGAPTAPPRRPEDRPDPAKLETRFER